MDFVDSLLLGAAIGAAIFVAKLVSVSSGKRGLQSGVATLPDFNSSHQALGADGQTSISIDEARRKVCLSAWKNGAVKHSVVSYRDLLSVEILQDGHSISKTSRVSQAGTALLGGILFGGVGAVVGALTGTKTTKGKITRVDIQIIVNDIESPMFLVNFLHDPAAENGLVHKQAMQKAREWMGRLNVLIRAADEEDRGSPGQSAASPISMADELTKLADLRKSGILSDEEFEAQKRRLLGTTDALIEGKK